MIVGQTDGHTYGGSGWQTDVDTDQIIHRIVCYSKRLELKKMDTQKTVPNLY